MPISSSWILIMFVYDFDKCRIGFKKATLANDDTEYGLSQVISDDKNLFKGELKPGLKFQKKAGKWW